MIKKQNPITILTTSFKQSAIIDTNYSLVWVEKYSDEGEFTLELPISFAEDDRIEIGYYVSIKDSKRIMKITDMNPIEDEDDGDKFVLKGPSAENILDSRVTDERWFLDGSLQALLLALIDIEMISPTVVEREINKFVTKTSTDPLVTALTITNTFDPSSIFDIVKLACNDENLGFRVEYDHPNRELVFSLYMGVDRSYDQDVNNRVIFSDSFDNVRSSNYYYGTKNYANVAIVLVDDVVHPKTTVFFGETEPSGIDRREIVIDATDIKRAVPNEPDLTDDQLLEVIYRRGWNTLLPLLPIGIFDGEIDTQGKFKYDEHFYLGDIVQCVFTGRDTRARVIEWVYTATVEGVVTYVSFEFNIDTIS